MRPHQVFFSIVGFFLALYIVLSTGVIAGYGKWHNIDITYHLQTDAFLNGRLSLSDRAMGHTHDQIWGNGLHQTWGLGIPFFLLPLELISRAFGHPYVPINLIYFIFLGCVITFSLFTFYDFIPIVNAKTRIIFSLFATSLFFINGLILFHASEFGRYALPFAFGNLASMVVLLCLIRLSNHPTLLPLLGVSFLAGCLPWIRPTLIFVTFSTFIVLIFFLLRLGVRFLIYGLLLGGVAPLLLLLTNYIRFGSPFEFGYTLSLSGTPLSYYQTRFGQAVDSESHLKLIKNYLQMLFFEGKSPLTGEVLKHKASRLIEIWYYAFDWHEFALVVLSFLGAAFFFFRFRESKLNKGLESRMAILFAWSSVIFIPLFLFYSRYHSIVDRYFIDFIPSVSGMILFFFTLIFIFFLNRSRLISILMCFGLAVSGYRMSFQYPKMIRSLRAAEGSVNTISWNETRDKILSQKAKWLESPNYALPHIYQCPTQTDFKKQMPRHLMGWMNMEDCRVGAATQLFLPVSHCIQMTLRYFGTQFITEYPKPKLHVGLNDWPLESEWYDDKNRIVFKYCHPSSVKLDPTRWAELVTIGFVKKEDVSDHNPVVGVLLEQVEALV